MRFQVFDEDEEDEDDEDDEDDEETCHVRAVDSWVCGSSANWKAHKKNWTRLGVGEIVVDSAADESCWPKGQDDAFSNKPSKKNIILKTANVGEMGLGDLTLWHDELPDNRETLLFSHVSLKISSSSFWPLLNPVTKTNEKIIPNGKVQNTHTYVTLGKRLALRIAFRRP